LKTNTPLAPHHSLAIRIFWIAAVLLIVGGSLRAARAAHNFYYLDAAMAYQERNINLSEYGLSVELAVQIRLIALYSVSFMGFAMGGYLFWRRADDWMAALIASALIGIGFEFWAPLEELARTELLWRLVKSPITASTMVCLLSFALVFPSGRLPHNHWRWLIVALALNEITRYGFNIFVNVTYVSEDSVPFWVVSWVMVLVGIGVLLWRYRHAPDVLQQQQMKWVLFAFSVMVLCILFTLVYVALLFGREAIFYIIGQVVVVPFVAYGGMILFILLMSFAVLRFRLWQVDNVINVSLVYMGLSAGLLAVFAGTLYVLLQTLRAFVPTLSGEQSAVALLAPTLLVGVAFGPARRRLQGAVDRWMYGDYVPQTRDLLDTPKTKTWLGKSIGEYQILQLLGEGGMGDVYAALSPSRQRTVALKVLASRLAQSDTYRQRFEREARTATALAHPNIVQVYESGRTADGNALYLVMEHLQGVTLAQYLHQRQRVPLIDLLPIVQDISDALDYAHQRGLVHRDVKPSNMMLTVTPPRAVLMDFGVAKSNDALTKLTHTGMIGTIDYIAPEQLMNARDVDARADVYSLAVVVYQALTGRLPFEGEVGQIISAHLYNPPPDPRTYVADLSSLAADALLRALRKTPAERFDSAGAFVAALSIATLSE
jgi:hypothetical protein